MCCNVAIVIGMAQPCVLLLTLLICLLHPSHSTIINTNAISITDPGNNTAYNSIFSSYLQTKIQINDINYIVNTCKLNSMITVTIQYTELSANKPKQVEQKFQLSQQILNIPTKPTIFVKVNILENSRENVNQRKHLLKFQITAFFQCHGNKIASASTYIQIKHAYNVKYIKTYIVNLKKDTHKLLQSMKRVKAAGFKDIERFPAVPFSNNHTYYSTWNGENNCSVDLKTCNRRKYIFHIKMSKSNKGCSLSHLLLWEKIARDNHNYGRTSYKGTPVLPDTSGVFEASNYVMLFLCYTLYFNSVLCYF